MVSYDDNFNKFFEENNFNRRSTNNISISKDDYKKLTKIAEEYKLLTEEYRKIQTKNEQLEEELKKIKQEENEKEEFNEIHEEKEKLYNSLLRTRADFENYKKRVERDNQQYKVYALENILKKLIQHYDDLNRTLSGLKRLENGDSISKGFELTVKNFEKILKEEGIEPMNCEGQKFDPYKQEVMIVEDRDDLPENTIIEELDKGYYYNNKVLKPAKVKISKKSSLQIQKLPEIKEIKIN